MNYRPRGDLFTTSSNNPTSSSFAPHHIIPSNMAISGDETMRAEPQVNASPGMPNLAPLPSFSFAQIDLILNSASLPSNLFADSPSIVEPSSGHGFGQHPNSNPQSFNFDDIMSKDLMGIKSGPNSGIFSQADIMSWGRICVEHSRNASNFMQVGAEDLNSGLANAMSIDFDLAKSIRREKSAQRKNAAINTLSKVDLLGSGSNNSRCGSQELKDVKNDNQATGVQGPALAQEAPTNQDDKANPFSTIMPPCAWNLEKALSHETSGDGNNPCKAFDMTDLRNRIQAHEDKSTVKVGVDPTMMSEVYAQGFTDVAKRPKPSSNKKASFQTANNETILVQPRAAIDNTDNHRGKPEIITVSVHISSSDPSLFLHPLVVTATGAFGFSETQHHPQVMVYSYDFLIPKTSMIGNLDLFFMGNESVQHLVTAVTFSSEEFGDISGPFVYDNHRMIRSTIYLVCSLPLHLIMGMRGQKLMDASLGKTLNMVAQYEARTLDQINAENQNALARSNKANTSDGSLRKEQDSADLNDLDDLDDMGDDDNDHDNEDNDDDNNDDDNNDDDFDDEESKEPSHTTPMPASRPTTKLSATGSKRGGGIRKTATNQSPSKASAQHALQQQHQQRDPKHEDVTVALQQRFHIDVIVPPPVTGSEDEFMKQGNRNLERILSKLVGVDKTHYVRYITRDDLLSVTCFSRDELAEQLNICLTLMKKIFRNAGLKTWPYRRLSSIRNRIVKLQQETIAFQDSYTNNCPIAPSTALGKKLAFAKSSGTAFLSTSTTSTISYNEFMEQQMAEMKKLELSYYRKLDELAKGLS